MKNEYKRSDIFICSNQAHSNFNKKVSAYHVLKVKKCFPDGCVYFYWKCKKLNKGESCHKKYEHVGRKCFGCKEFYDVKITNQLQVNENKEEWDKFQEELADFEDWLETVRGKTLQIYGEIDNVKPHFTKRSSENVGLELKGFILTFKECYIDRTFFEDFAFARINTTMYQRFRFSPGDKLDFLATVDEDRGRILFYRLMRIEFTEHEDNSHWDQSKINVTLSTASVLSQQLEKCHFCQHGVLVDLKGSYEDFSKSRQMYCLAGCKDAKTCVIPVLEKITGDDGCPPK
jgi:hypothetical protein